MTAFLKTIANRGRTLVSGVVTGACVSTGDSKAEVWECVLSRTGRKWPAKSAARQWRVVASFGWCRKKSQNERNDECSYLKSKILIMSERMIPGGILRSDARGSAKGRKITKERLLLAFLNTGMWVAGEIFTSLACPRSFASLERRGCKAHDENEVNKKGGFLTEVEESGITGFS